MDRTRLQKHLRAGFVLALLGTTAFSVAACGRNGPPEPPPGPLFSSYPPPETAPSSYPPPAAAPAGPAIADAAPAAPGQAQQRGFDAYGNPVAPASERKSFFLDFILQ